MEELQSTEVLDREILEDARKKAARILKSAEDQSAASDRDWERRTGEALAELRRRYAGRLEQTRKEIMARLPLDKRRARLKKLDAMLHEAARGYLNSLGREELLALLEMELEKRAGEFRLSGAGTGPLRASCRGLEPEEIEKIMGRCFAGFTWTLEESPPPPGRENFPALTLDSGAVLVSISAEKTMEFLLEERREELASALLGGEALDA